MSGPLAGRPEDALAPAATPPAPPRVPVSLTPEQVRLLPFYHDLRNEIVEPDRVVVSTQYFWTKWAPRLGPTLTALIVCLRRHCYYNRLTQERRDWCFPEQATLAREIGVETTKTIRAALQHPLASHFVRREARYTYDPRRGKKVRTSDMYYVAMDDPLTPEDESLLLVRAAERLLAEGRAAELASNETAGRSGGQNDLQVVSPGGAGPGGKKGRQVPPPDGRIPRQDSAVIPAPEVVHDRGTNTTRYSITLPPGVAEAFAAANGAAPSPAQLARLAALCAQFDPAARQDDPPTTGAQWVLAAIHEAVESGSRYVAPRRIARICERWAAEGRATPAPPATPRPGAEASPAAKVATPARPERRIGLSSAGRRLAAPSPERSREPVPLSEPRPDPLEREEAAEGHPGRVAQPGEPVEAAGRAHDLPAGIDPDDPKGVFSSGAPIPSSVPSFVVASDLGLLSRPFWQAVCDEAQRRLGSPAEVALLAGSQLLARQGATLIVGLPSRSAARRATLRLAAPLEGIVRAILGRPVELCFVSLAEGTGHPAPPSAATEG